MVQQSPQVQDSRRRSDHGRGRISRRHTPPLAYQPDPSISCLGQQVGILGKSPDIRKARRRRGTSQTKKKKHDRTPLGKAGFPISVLASTPKRRMGSSSSSLVGDNLLAGNHTACNVSRAHRERLKLARNLGRILPALAEKVYSQSRVY